MPTRVRAPHSLPERSDERADRLRSAADRVPRGAQHTSCPGRAPQQGACPCRCDASATRLAQPRVVAARSRRQRSCPGGKGRRHHRDRACSWYSRSRSASSSARAIGSRPRSGQPRRASSPSTWPATSTWPTPTARAVTQLTSGPDVDTRATWSPDGTTIAYESRLAADLSTSLIVMGADGSHRTSLGGSSVGGG